MRDTSRIASQNERVLIVCDDETKISAVAGIFRAYGFDVERANELQAAAAGSEYGAIVHIANSAAGLRTRLGNELSAVQKEEWILVLGENDDFYCTVQLTSRASLALTLLVRSLWSIFSTT